MDARSAAAARRLARSPVTLATAAAAGTAALAYGSLYERSAFTLRRFEVPVLPDGTAPLRLLHLSDVHIRAGQRRKTAWIRDLARLLPDLVVVTGDNLGGGPGCVAAMLEALEPLLDLPGAFVLGSNDYYAPKPKNPLKYFFPGHRRVQGDPLPWPDLVEAMTARGWLDLTNRRDTVKVADLALELRGVDDPHLRRDRLDEVAGPGAEDAVQVGVVHAPEPRVLDSFTRDGATLLLSGHTHGGQLRVPGVGALVTNCGLDRARCRGLSRYTAGDLAPGGPAPDAPSAWLHVSAGLGTSVYAPVRFACPPEASLLTLTPAAAGQPGA